MRNVVSLIGRVGSDPEMRTVGNSKVCNISLATSETYKDKEGNKQVDTQWHKLVLWDKAAEIAMNHVKKGDLFCIDGKIKYRDYTDKEGVKRYSTEIQVTEMLLMPNKKEEVA